MPSSEPGFRLVEEIDLLLDRSWAATNPHDFKAGATLRTSIYGPHRFTVHLVDAQLLLPPRRRKYEAIESTQETMKVVRDWRIPRNGRYAFIVDPVGNAPFHVSVKVDEGLITGPP